MAARYDLKIEQGATFTRTILWRDSTGAPVNLTGYIVRFQFKASAGASASLLSFDSSALTTGQTLAALDTTGTITFTLADELTAAFAFSTAAWDLLVESPGGQRFRLAQGAVVVSPSVTR